MLSTGNKSRENTKSTNCLLLTISGEKFGLLKYGALFSACLETNSRPGDGLFREISAGQELM
jgi:hypothetical protein